MVASVRDVAMLQKIQMNPLQLLTFAKMLKRVQTKVKNPASVLISVAMLQRIQMNPSLGMSSMQTKISL